MKFLCDNCKAKYQIPDEKIQGRTLRMKCRKCEHDIIIRGDGGDARPVPKTVAPGSALSIPASTVPSAIGPSSASVAAPRSRTSGTGVPPRAATASALGADFQKRVAAGGASAPAERPDVGKLWHVAINDVPVGPIRREDLAKKVGTGEVTAESLCWREGFDDWRPVREVSELASLLDQRRPPAIRASGDFPPEPSRPSIDPIGGRHGASAGSPAAGHESDDDDATIVGTSPLMHDMEAQEERERLEREQKRAAASRSRSQEREVSVKVAAAAIVPPAASPAPEVAQIAKIDTPAPTARPVTPATTDSLMPPARKKRAMSPGVLMAIASALGFGMMMAFLLVDRVFAPATPPPVAQQPPVTPPVAEQPIARTDLETDVEGEIADPSAAEAPAAPVAVQHPTTAHPVAGQPRTTNTTTTTPPATAQNLTAEQRAMMERMGASDTERLPASNITVPTTTETTGAAHGPLSASDLSGVVTRNRIQLQRCHERALRGMSSAPAVRMDVSLRVSTAGTVTTATASGTDFGGLKSCIEQSVRRWRFPESSSGGETHFPVVFQAVN